jgi:hypothetical protein
LVWSRRGFAVDSSIDQPFSFVSHSKALAIFLGIFVVMPVLLFFGLRWLARRWLHTQPSRETATEPKGLQRFVQISTSARTILAVAICLFTAVWGAVAIRRGWGRVSSTAFNVAFCWFMSGSWLAGELTREVLKRRFDSPLSRIYRDALEGKSVKTPPLARAMNRGGGVLVLVGIVGWFV